MDSTARFLLGGALGAALGYLLSQKNLEKAMQGGELAVPATSHLATTVAGLRAEGVPAAPTVAPPMAAAAPVFAPEPRPVAAPATTSQGPESSIPPAPPSDWRPAPTSPPAAAVSASPVAPAAPSDYAETPAAVEFAESEIILTRDFLEEPVPGSGWRSSPTPVVEADTLEDIARIVPDVVLSRVGPEVGRSPLEETPTPSTAATSEQVMEEPVAELPVVEDVVELPVVDESVELPVVEESAMDTGVGVTAQAEALADAASVMGRIPVAESRPAENISRVDDLKSRIEETRRRIRHELEQPFDTAVAPKPPERDWTMPPVVLPGQEPIVVEPVAAEATHVDPAPVEAVPVEQATVESIAFEPPVLEQVVVETVAFEPLAVEPTAAEPMVEEPVYVEPAAMEPIVVAPVVAETVDATLETVAEAAEDDDAGVALGLEEPVDYDSMKDRIETTRSRLKAKAFDAMMTGESSLLGRDLEGGDRGKQKLPGVDDEVDDTIETSLREEE
jgi:hypothetical protein